MTLKKKAKKKKNSLQSVIWKNSLDSELKVKEKTSSRYLAVLSVFFFPNEPV